MQLSSLSIRKTHHFKKDVKGKNVLFAIIPYIKCDNAKMQPRHGQLHTQRTEYTEYLMK